MTSASTSTPRRPSKFLELLRTYSHAPGGSRVGFLARAEPRKRRIALLAAVSRLDTQAIAAAIKAGADAVEVRIESPQDLRALGDLAKTLGVPLGIAIGAGAGATMAEAAAEAGVDWLRVGLDTPISAAGWERPARFLTLPADLDPRVAAGISGLAVDAVQVLGGVSTGAELSFGDAMRLRVLREVVRKPFLLPVDQTVPPAAVAACSQLGVDALVVGADGAEAAGVIAAYVAALEEAAAHTD